MPLQVEGSEEKVRAKLFGKDWCEQFILPNLCQPSVPLILEAIEVTISRPPDVRHPEEQTPYF